MAAGAVEEVYVQLAADTRAFLAQVDHAVNQAAGKTEKIGKAVDSQIQKWGKLALAAGAAIASYVSIRQLEGAINATQELGLAVAKMSRETGLSAEDASRLIFAFHHVGLTADDASRSIGIFAKKLKGVSDEETGVTTGGKSTAEILADIGVKATDASGNLLGIDQILGPLADRFKTMPDGLEKTGLAMQLFGRSGKDMIPLLNQGSAGLEELAKQADNLGVTLTAKNVAAIKAFTFAQRDLNEAFAGLKVQIGLAVMPVLTRFMDWVISVQPTVRGFVSELVDMGQKAGAALAPVGDALKTLFGLLDRKDVAVIFAAISAAIVAGLVAIAVQAGITFVATNAALLGIPIAVAAIITAITLLVRHWEEVWADLQAAPAAILDWLENNWKEAIVDVIVGPLALIVKHWKDIFNQMPAPVQKAMNVITGIIEAAVNWILDRLATLLDALADVAGALADISGWIPIVGAGIGDLEGKLRGLAEAARRGTDLTFKATVKSSVEGVDQLLRRAEEYKKTLAEIPAAVPGAGGGGAAPGGAEATQQVVAYTETLDDLTATLLGLWRAAGATDMEVAGFPWTLDLARRAAERLGLTTDDLLDTFRATGQAFGDFMRELAASESLDQLKKISDAVISSLSDLRSQFNALFGAPTREQAAINYQLAQLKLRRAQMVAAGATDEALAGIGREIARIETINTLRDAEADVMRAELDLADRTLLSDAEQYSLAGDIISRMADLSAAAVPVIQLYLDQAEAMQGWIDSMNAILFWAAALPLPTAQVPSMQGGGIVPGPRGQPQLILAHGGEGILPVGGSLNLSLAVNIDRGADEMDIARRAHEALSNLLHQARQRSYLAGAPLGSGIG